MIRKILISLAIIITTGCAAPTIYYWGDYSDTLYQYTKEPTQETLAAHRNELMKIIDVAETKQKKVPPGIYFELGMIEAKAGNIKMATAYLQKEQALFPESETYVALALKEIEVI
ncbi:DUF4810 domain-containing protein [Thalassotalea mangrovi]|uniref:DUF4810 domain-containing protein n=1 Tax=Thalassotalea mangrovi TaxID=2572245 RepID=A0A4U1B6T8_9GAMM|nr:DUF4810 domain-containing protein [Thalassotalea mangrovi]TKB45572.1 DUF4810 domain-containing protein [Thalassotalea mangrovi]